MNQAELRDKIRSIGAETRFFEIGGNINEYSQVCIPAFGLSGRYYFLSERELLDLINQEKVTALEEARELLPDRESKLGVIRDVIDTMIENIKKGGE